MTNAATPPVPADWYADPAGGPRSRWWDGTQWTEHFQEPYSPAAAAAALKAPEGTRTNTIWVWLVVVVPLLPLFGLLTIDFSSYFHFDYTDPSSITSGELALFTSPGYLVSTLGGWVVYALGALFAYLDWKKLKELGVPRPFHFAWVFLSSIVYVIGRSVVVRRRTGHGSAPMWAAIASIVVSLVISIIFTIQVSAAMLASFPSLSS